MIKNLSICHRIRVMVTFLSAFLPKNIFQILLACVSLKLRRHLGTRIPQRSIYYSFSQCIDMDSSGEHRGKVRTKSFEEWNLGRTQLRIEIKKVSRWKISVKWQKRRLCLLWLKLSDRSGLMQVYGILNVHPLKSSKLYTFEGWHINAMAINLSDSLNLFDWHRFDFLH